MRKLLLILLFLVPVLTFAQTTYYPKPGSNVNYTQNSFRNALNLHILGSWAPNTNGSGTAPTGFGSGQILSLTNPSWVDAGFYTFIGTWRVESNIIINKYDLLLDDTLIHSGTVTLQDTGYFRTSCDEVKQYTTTGCKGIGALGRPIASGASEVFHVGHSKYNPVSIKNNNASLDTFFVRVSDSTKRYGIQFDNNLLNRMWTISKKGAGNSDGVDISFHWNNTDQVIGTMTNPAVFVFENNGWTKLTTTKLSDTAVAISAYKGALSSTQFIVADDANGIPLKVNFITPFNGQSVLAGTNDISIEFNKAVSASLSLADHIKLIGLYSGQISGTFTGGGTSTIKFTPTKSFIPGEPITVHVLKTIGTTRIFSSQFSVGSNNFIKYSYGKTEVGTNTFDFVFPADIDSDGDMDIVTNDGGKSGWQKNDGNGVFTFQEVTSSFVRFFHAADLDLDGDMDLISFVNNNLYIWKQNAGAFPSTGDIFYTAPSGSPSGMRTADVDGDGDLDILCSIDTKLVLLKNNGSLNFTATDIKTLSTFQSIPNLNDLDNDGDVDILISAGNGYNKVNWFLNDGTGVFTEGLSPLSSISDLTSTVLLHMDKDQLLDLAYDAPSSLNKGLPLHNNKGEDATFLFQATPNLVLKEGSGTISKLLAADMNGDGNTDIIYNHALSGASGSAKVYQQNDTGFVRSGFTIGSSSYSPSMVQYAADFNGDGFTDLLTSGGDGQKKTVVYINTAIAPNIVSSTLASDNSYIDITFSAGVYGTLGGSQSLPGSGPITASSLKVLFEQSGGTATNVTILSVNKPDSTDYDVAGKLVGGETVVRVFLDITGYPDGKETVEIVPALNAAIYSSDGTGITSKQTSGVKILNSYVTVHPTGISIDKPTVDLFVGGDSDSLTAIVLPKKTTDKSVTWSTSNAQVATVDANGNVTPISLGTADITATTVDGGLTASSAITVHPLTDRVFNQDGFSSSGFILKSPLSDDYVLRGLTNYNFTTPISWGSMKSIVYDKKQTIWLIPSSITSGVAFVRINTTTKEVEKTLAKADFSMSVSAAVMVEDDIWFVPNSSDFVIKWNTKTFTSTKYNNWPSGVTFQNNSDKFMTGFYDGQKIWMCGGHDNKVVSIDAQSGEMKTYTWPTVRTFNGLVPSIISYSNTLNANSFRGAVFDGHNIWFVPHMADRVVKLDTRTEQMTSYENWPANFDKLDPKSGYYGQTFSGGVFDGKNVWLIPLAAGSYVKIDTATGSMESYGTWPTGIKQTWEDQLYSGGIFDGKYIWSAPYFTAIGKSKAVIRFNTETGDIAKYENYPTAIPFRDNSQYFTGGVFDGKQVWFTGTGNNLQAFPLVYMGLPDVSVTSVALNKDTIIMRLGAATQSLTATVSPTNASDKRVTWSSRNSSIASVNTSGVVSAVATGTTRILVTTTDGSFKDSTVVIVLDRDTDGDGVDDTRETADGTDKNDAKKFKDSDGDGVPDAVETEQGTDPNDKSSFKDTDQGGIPDYVEEVLQPAYGLTATDPNDNTDDTADTDKDGVSDYQEIIDGTDPSDSSSYKDSDNDLVPDAIEGSDLSDSTDAKKYKDSDGDGVPDYIEAVDGTDPNDKTDFKDTDGGGMPDYVETVLLPNYGLPANDKNQASDDTKDSDNDGVSDFQEVNDGTDPNDPGKYKDSDGDAVPDEIEIIDGTNPNDKDDFKDSDTGGIPDYVETVLLPNYNLPATDPNDKSDDDKISDYDKDGVPDFQEFKEGSDPKDSTDYKDNDGDHVPDYIELVVDGTDNNNPSSYKDTDGDGIPDYVEDIDGTDPNDKTDYKDTDGDGVPDFIEDVFENTDPNDDADYKDNDGDLIPNYIELEKDITDDNDPSEFKDTDKDGVPDYIEEKEGTDPNDKSKFKDSDGDGVPDYTETMESTDPNDKSKFKDTDGDGVPDYVEKNDKTDPAVKDEYKDSDGDGVPDYVENNDGTDPEDAKDFKDSDGDFVPDYIENKEGTNPANKNDFKDSDTGGVPDYVEDTLLPNSGLKETDPTDDTDDNSDFDGDGKSDYDELLDGTNPNDAPATITYSPSSLTVTKGVQITAITPTFTGGKPKSYAINPNLPTGMTIDPSTGKISGTPSVLQTTAVTYTITATNDGGSKTVTFTLTVNDVAPSVTYSPTAVVATKGNSITINPTSTGGTVLRYAISPALPANLTIDQNTGVVSGTPAAVNTNSVLYTVSATNSGGTSTTTFSLVINDAPPSNLSYSPASQRATKNVAISSMTPSSSGGTVVNYSITPALPGGLLFNTTTGAISGTLTATLSGSVEYTITATNSGGSTTTKVTIVYNTPPSDLSINKSNIFDSNAIGDLIGTLSTADVDENETHTYSLVSGQGSTNNSAFTINGNRLLANRVYNYDVQRSYSIRVRTTDRGGLYHEEVINVTISKTPIVEGSSSSLYYGLINTKPVISLGNQSQLQISSTEIDSVSWTPSTGLSATNILNPIATPKVTTTYTVYIRNIYGSVVVLNITVEVKNDYSIQVSNIVTPNNDGINDFWVIDNIQNYPDNEVTIFDRNGKIMYKTANYNNRWDGRVNGKLMATGTYYYIVRFRNNPKALHKGYITLVNE